MSSQSQGSAGGMLMTLALLTLIILVAVWYMNLPGNTSLERRIGDAVDSTPRVVAHATDRLTGHDTTAKVNQTTAKVDNTLKKTGDAASSAAAELGNDIKAAVDEQKKQNAAHRPDHLSASAKPTE